MMEEEENKQDLNHGLFMKLTVVLCVLGTGLIFGSKTIDSQMDLMNIGLWINFIGILLFLFLKNRAS